MCRFVVLVALIVVAVSKSQQECEKYCSQFKSDTSKEKQCLDACKGMTSLMSDVEANAIVDDLESHLLSQDLSVTTPPRPSGAGKAAKVADAAGLETVLKSAEECQQYCSQFKDNASKQKQCLDACNMASLTSDVEASAIVEDLESQDLTVTMPPRPSGAGKAAKKVADAATGLETVLKSQQECQKYCSQFQSDASKEKQCLDACKGMASVTSDVEASAIVGDLESQDLAVTMPPRPSGAGKPAKKLADAGTGLESVLKSQQECQKYCSQFKSDASKEQQCLEACKGMASFMQTNVVATTPQDANMDGHDMLKNFETALITLLKDEECYETIMDSLQGLLKSLEDGISKLGGKN